MPSLKIVQSPRISCRGRSGVRRDLSKSTKNVFRTAQLHTQQKPLYGGVERTPQKEGMPYFLSASLSVEAALVLPLFLFFMCLLIYPMKVMDAQCRAQVKLEECSELVSASEGIRSVLKEDRTADVEKEQSTKNGCAKNADADTGSVLTGAAEVYSGVKILAAFDHDTLGIPIITGLSAGTEEDPMTKISVTCVVVFPFSKVFGSFLQPIRFVTYRRNWVGRKGGEAGEGGSYVAAAGEESDRIVYVARNSVNSGRYHVSDKCHYIDNVMTSVSIREIRDLRNSNGGKYHACGYCQPGRCQTVYIFKSGDAYHSSTSCRVIGSYATEMKESEAKRKGLSPCSYCGRK